MNPIQNKLSLWVALVLGAWALASPVATAAQATNSTPRHSLNTFKIIRERNIFNANRRPGVVQSAPRPERISRVESFSLIGTMLHEGGMFAFFDGSDAQYKKVLKPGDAIAGYKIVEVSNDAVKLESEGAPVVLPMGMKMTRRDEEKWQVLVGATSSSSSFGEGDRRSAFESRRDRSSSASEGGRDRGTFEPRRDRRDRSSTDAAGVAGAATGSEGAADDILKRLMQKREQELNK